MNAKFKNKGFTLIELLVVIAIIGVLASVILASLNTARAKARDARRLSDMHQIQLALDLYYDQYGIYPRPIDFSCSWNSSGVNPDKWIQPLKDAGFLSTVPVDPQNTGGCSAPSYAYYRYNAGSYGCDASRGAFYVLGIRNLETSNNPYKSSPGWSCPSRNWQREFDWVVGEFEN